MAHIIVRWKELIPKGVGCYVGGYQESCETCDIEHCENCCEVKHFAEFETKNYRFDEDKDNFDPDYFGTFTSRRTGTIKPYYLKIDDEELIYPGMVPVHMR